MNTRRSYFHWSSVVLALWLTTLILGQLTRWQFSSSMSLYAHDVLAVVIGVTGVVVLHKKILAWGSKYRLELLGAAAFLTIGWLIAVVTGLSVVRPVLSLARLATYVIATYSIWQWQASHQLAKAMISIWLVIFAVLGLLQYVLFPDTRWLAVLGWDSHYYRLIGTLLDPSYTGLLLVMAFWWIEGQARRYSVLGLLAQLICAIGIGVSFSRATWLAFGLSIVWMLWRVKNHELHNKVVLLAIVAIVAVWIAPKPGGEGVRILRTASANARVVSSANWLELTPTQWVIGRGFGVSPIPSEATEIADHSHWPDNLLALLISGFGVVGTTMVLYLIWQYRSVWNSWTPLLQTIWIVVLIHSQFNHSLLQPFIWCWLILMTRALQLKANS